MQLTLRTKCDILQKAYVMKKVKLKRPNRPVYIFFAVAVGLVGLATIALTRAASTTINVNDNVIGTGVNQWQYTGSGWAYYTDGGNKFQGDDHSSSASGDYATLKFSGIKAEYYGAKSPQAGIVAISVDGGTEAMIDLYSATRIDNTLLYSSSALTTGTHTLKIRLTGTKNASANAAAAAVDRAVVTTESGSSTSSSFEAEDGTLTNGATSLTDGTASNGLAAKFKSPTVTPPVGGALPSKLVGAYWQMYLGPNVSEITANAPQYSLQYASFALGSDSNGHVSFNPVFQGGASLKNDIAASKAAGSKWLISLGGGSDTTIRLLNETNASNMFDSLVGIIDSYGFQGIDYDLECGSACFNPDAAASLAQKLKTKYGPNFIVSAAPRPYEARGAGTIYGAFALKAGNNLDLFGLQFYDFPETRNTAQLTSLINNDIATVVAMGVPPSKIMIGCITYTQYNLGWNTVDVYKNIFLQQEQKYPDLRGVFIWESSLDKKENWSFAKVMGPAVL